MMEPNRMKSLMDATSGIREEYIEEAAADRVKRNWLVRIASVAAVLALVIGMTMALWPEENLEPIPFFAIRAYAADGSVAVLDELGDTAVLKTGKSDLFPGKKVYTLDVSLEGYTGSKEDLLNGQFRFLHKSKMIKPGESDEYLAVQWLSEEEDGFFGYRIIGWCDKSDTISLTIYDADYQRVLHDKQIRITNDRKYSANLRISYTYQEDRTTDELIDLIMMQDYTFEIMLSSDFYQRHLRYATGFGELTQRPDAVEKLLERYVRIMNGEQLYVFSGILGDETWQWSNDYLIGAILSWDEFWNQMTLEQQLEFASYGQWRAPEGYSSLFPGKRVFEYWTETVYGQFTSEITVQILQNGEPMENVDEHIKIRKSIPSPMDTQKRYSWSLTGWVEEPTELTILVTNDIGWTILKEVIMVTPVEDGYEIEVLETSE